MDNDELEIVDTENYIGQKNIVFSHQDLVMRSMKRVLEIAGHDLTEGISISQSKNKEGRIAFKEDTRKAFINAVKICKCVMKRDFDNETEKIINKILLDIKTREKELLKAQWNWWISLNPKQKQDRGIILEPAFFNKSLAYYIDYVEFQIEKSWEIFEELNNLTARLGDYQIEDFEG